MLSSRVPPAHAGRSLLEYLVARFRYHDAPTWRALIEDGRVEVDGRRADHRQLLVRGALVSYEPLLPEPDAPLDLVLLHEEESFLVVEKPAGLVCHSDGAFRQNTFVRELERQCSERAGKTVLLRLAHRIDRETSGLLLVSRTVEAARHFERQFTQGLVGKRYLAIVRGELREEAFEIEHPIGFAAQSEISIRRSAAADARAARSARTSIEVLARRSNRTLIRCIPRTGRTHQIRVHLERIGHPIVGDKLYGTRDAEYLAWVHAVKARQAFDAEARFGAPMQLLHAAELEFVHPLEQRRVQFRASWPQRFEACGFTAADYGKRQ